MKTPMRPRLDIIRGIRRVSAEELLSVYVLAGEIGVSHPCLARWIIRGKLAPNGARGFLDAVLRSGEWLSSREACERFLSRIEQPAAA